MLSFHFYPLMLELMELQGREYDELEIQVRHEGDVMPVEARCDFEDICGDVSPVELCALFLGRSESV